MSLSPRCSRCEWTRLQELFMRRHEVQEQRRAPCAHLLGTPSNALASGALDWCPEWHLEYRIARDGAAYNREEFKNHYGCECFDAYWAEAKDATEAQKHARLLSVLRSHCDRLRMRKVAAAFRCHTQFDDAIIENIASFVAACLTEM